MNTLVIDTASNLEIVAARSGTITAEASEFVGASHSLALLDNVERCLKKLGLSIRDMDCIGVGIGPGSFTGIRIAVATGRMLAQLLGKPLVGIKTQLLYAVTVNASINDNILIAFDAKKSRVFGALYRKSDDALHPAEIVPPGDYDIQKLLNSIDQARPTYLIGSGIEKYGDIIQHTIGKRMVLAGYIPDGKNMCDLITQSYRESPEQFADYNRVVPFYARKSDAEAAKGN